MRHFRLPLVQITCLLLLVTSCTQAIKKQKSTIIDSIQDGFNDTLLGTTNYKRQLKDGLKINIASEENEANKESLPVLPPLILLDFTNNENKSELNTTDLNDEKSKRTINENVGYGFKQNDIFSGKHNFYFPIGKTGTTVSIEESIEPFKPKTITEIVKPINEGSDLNITQNEYKNYDSADEILPAPLPLQINREPLPIYPPYPSFGQRTKLQQTSSSNFEQYEKKPPIQQFSKSHPPPNLNNHKLISSYTSMKPAGYQLSSSDYSASTNANNYVRPMPLQYIKNYMTGSYSGSSSNSDTIVNNKKLSNNPRITKINIDNNKEYDFTNYPRYTIENGIKYEHKIIWKYPDGKISETPPMSYMNSRSEYVDKQKPDTGNMDNIYSQNYYQYHPVTSKQQQNIQGNSYISYSGNTQNNIYSQKPVQFPIEQEQATNPKEESKFIPVMPTDNSYQNNYESINSYNPENHQGQYGYRLTPQYDSQEILTNHKNQDDSYNNHIPVDKYASHNVNTEYNYQMEKTQGNLHSLNGQIAKEVVVKYPPEEENYRVRIPLPGRNIMKSEDSVNEYKNYPNTDYSQILNYNPSISQYIKNPSSILNAQPTFVQLGNSLIPVIILRVDGALPIKNKSATNINLKALLRQYLTKYATSISKPTLNTNYDLGAAINNEQIPIHQENPIEDLKHLTESLASLRHRGYENAEIKDNNNHNYLQKSQLKYQQNSRVQQEYNSNYNRFIKDYQMIHAGQQLKKSQQKVKSVQIIEDPTYK